MVYKARKGSNFKPYQRKLTPTQAARLVADVRVHKMTRKAAAEKYGVSPGTIKYYLNPDLRPPEKERPQCGTNAAYQSHIYHKEIADDACVKAHNEDRRKRMTERDREKARIRSQKRRDEMKAAGIKEWSYRSPAYKARDAEKSRLRRQRLKEDAAKLAAFRAKEAERKRLHRIKKQEEKING